MRAAMPPASEDEPASALRRRLVDALSRGRPGTTPPRVSREHSLPPERRADGIVVQRVMLAPEPGDGREHAVPVVLVHRHSHEEDRSRPRPVVAFLHGTGGDTEGLLDAHLVPLAERGYVAVGVDAPCHGRRLDPEKPARDTTKSAAEKTTTSAAAAAAAAGDHRALVRPRAETFERYGAALVAACRGASDTSDSERRPNVARTSPELLRGSSSGVGAESIAANPTTWSTYRDPPAPVSIVAGTGGGGFTRNAVGAAFAQVTMYEFGHVRLTALNATALVGEFVDARDRGGSGANERTVLDRFAIVKTETETKRPPRR
jgi:hypothetical protein